MENIRKILTEISKTITNIETNYPEVYKYLCENPVTIPNQQDPKVGAKELQNYLESLKDLIKKFKEEG
jgi:hypothetical protein